MYNSLATNTTINEKLLEIDWQCLDTMDVNDASDHFTLQLTNVLDMCAPNKTIVIPSKNIVREPWMTKGLIKSSKTKLKLYASSIRKTPNDPNYKKFVEYRNMYNKTKRTAKRQYYSQKLLEHKNDMKKTWDIINMSIGKFKSTSDVQRKFIINDHEVTDKQTISDEFCTYFTEFGSKLAINIPQFRQ